VNRIEAADITPFVFQKSADFDLSTYLAESFGIFGGSDDITVVVKFLPAAARYVLESGWHASQVLSRQRDGSVLARFQLSSTVEIKSWVLNFGASAVVLEPEALRTEISAELEQLTKMYSVTAPRQDNDPSANGPVRPERRTTLDRL
jgi:predicted DNA-binding transcriptional regulator YafY